MAVLFNYISKLVDGSTQKTDNISKNLKYCGSLDISFWKTYLIKYT